MKSATALLRAKAAVFRAAADDLDALASELEGGDASELLDADAVEAHCHVRMRVVIDASRRGELVITHAGRRPLVGRAELDRWLAVRASSPTRPLRTLQVVPSVNADEAAFARSVARAGGRRR